jgi:anaerobic sulfite reductase subunit B
MHDHVDPRSATALATAPSDLPEPMQPLPHRVIERRIEGPQVVTLALAPLDRAIEVPQPGQFLMVWVFGVGEVPISVSGRRPDGTIELTVRAAGATSSSIVDVGLGEVLGARGPYGTGWPLHAVGDHDVVVMAGGLGVAPLRLALDALTNGTAPPRRLTILFGAREPNQLLYPDDIERWTAAGAEVHLTVDAADRRWHGAVGTVTALLGRLGPVGDLAFVCGPELMMLSGARALAAQHVPPDQIHVSLERNMHCGVAHCGRCQLGPLLLCRDGAVVSWDRVAEMMAVRGR